MKEENSEPLLVEVAWEVCNQVGGIYTVIRSKVPAMKDNWKNRYCLVGPYTAEGAASEFEPASSYDDPFGKAVLRMREMGFEVHYGSWLVSGKPRVVLLNYYSAYHRLGDIKYRFWQHHDISIHGSDQLLEQVIAFGEMVKVFFNELVHHADNAQVVGHFHEWMAGSCLPDMRHEQSPVVTVFTTHATLLGRYLAMHDRHFYDHLPYFDWLKEARHFNIEPTIRIERGAANSATVFTTVSEVTAKECVQLLGRRPDVILPNGLNIERFEVLHEFQNLHLKYKEKIHQFVMGHFFGSYSFDLDKTLYFFTSGRYEYSNKGFDLTLEALARLNWRMREHGIDTTVVTFFVTKQPYTSINPAALQSRAIMQELRATCEAIEKQVGDRLFYTAAAAGAGEQKFPDLNEFVDEVWRLRLRRLSQSWKSHKLPLVVTHNLVNDSTDEILNFLRMANLVNNRHDKVKVVYHPDFISHASPLFGLEYGQFVRGCNLGVFPSYYEPWGYTPLECIARGVPTVTSDLSGFGDYVVKTMPDHLDKGIYVVNRSDRSFDDAANQLTDTLFAFVLQNRRERISQRNSTESVSTNFAWKTLTTHYERAYRMALQSKKPNFTM